MCAELIPRDEKAFLPRLDAWDVRIIRTNEEADAVAKEGFEEKRPMLLRRKGSRISARCLSIRRGRLHMVRSRSASTLTAPYHVDFNGGQACTGGTYTIERFRGKGLMAYGYYLRLEYLRKLGYKTSRNAVAVANITSQKVHAKLDPEIRGTGRFIKVLRWSHWKEEPLPGGPARGLPPAAGR